MFQKLYFFAILLLITNASAQHQEPNSSGSGTGSQVDNATTNSRTHQSEWIEVFLRTSRMVVNRCRKISSIETNVDGNSFLRCLEMTTLRAIDRLLELDVIELPFGLKLIKDSNQSHETNKTILNNLAAKSRSFEVTFRSNFDLKREILIRVTKLLRTHSLQIPMLTNVSVGGIFEGRRRHHRHKHQDMMGLILFGMMGMAIIAMPMGFQFLAVLGGKALMLAKLALILTSIHGLKKIATSHLSYGLYHHPHDLHHPHDSLHHHPHSLYHHPHHHYHHPHHHLLSHYDRRWQDEHSETPTEYQDHQGIFDTGYNVPPDSHQNLDEIRARIMLPRIGFVDGAPARE